MAEDKMTAEQEPNAQINQAGAIKPLTINGRQDIRVVNPLIMEGDQIREASGAPFDNTPQLPSDAYEDEVRRIEQDPSMNPTEKESMIRVLLNMRDQLIASFHANKKLSPEKAKAKIKRDY